MNDLPLNTADQRLVHRVLLAAVEEGLWEAGDALAAFENAMATQEMRDAGYSLEGNDDILDAGSDEEGGDMEPDDERREKFDERFNALKAESWHDLIDDDGLCKVFDVLSDYIVALIELNGGWREATEDCASVFLRAGKDEAIRIGNEIHAKYGFDGMLFVHDTVSQILARGSGRELEFAWDGIGSWRC